MVAPRLSKKEALIIRLLLKTPKINAAELAEKSNGALKKNTVYTTLYRMEHKGLVVSKAQAPAPTSGLPKRCYRATEFGKRIYQALEQVARMVNG